MKFFLEAGLLLRNPDKPDRPTNSGGTVYQIEPSALAMLRTAGTHEWARSLFYYLANVEMVKREIAHHRELARVLVKLPDGKRVALSPGGQNPLTKAIIEDFLPSFCSWWCSHTLPRPVAHDTRKITVLTGSTTRSSKPRWA